jgi:hypothetical protein
MTTNTATKEKKMATYVIEVKHLRTGTVWRSAENELSDSEKRGLIPWLEESVSGAEHMRLETEEGDLLFFSGDMLKECVLKLAVAQEEEQ